MTKPQPKLLVIDDNDALRRMVARALCARFSVTACAGLRDALSLFDASRGFDVLLCDMNLEDGTGQDFYERLRERSIEQSDRVLFFSGSDCSNGNEHGNTNAAFIEATRGRHLSKPMPAAALIDHLTAMVALTCPTVPHFKPFAA